MKFTILENWVEIVSSFVLGFVAMWVALRFGILRPTHIENKQTMIEMANTYGNNQKICKELKDYSMKQIKHGNYEFIEVIDTIKRQSNDKSRT
jgi:hypothetical protein